MNKLDICALFGCTVDQLNQHYAANTQTLIAMKKKATRTKKKVNGYTASELAPLADKFARITNASEQQQVTSVPNLDTPIVTESYKGHELRTRENMQGNKWYTTLIYKDDECIGACFAGPSENSDSVAKAKLKIDSYTKG